MKEEAEGFTQQCVGGMCTVWEKHKKGRKPVPPEITHTGGPCMPKENILFRKTALNGCNQLFMVVHSSNSALWIPAEDVNL